MSIHTKNYVALHLTLKIIWTTLMVLLSVVFIYPMVYGIIGSFFQIKDFQSLGSFFIWPKAPTLTNYTVYLSVDFASGALSPLLNSFMRAGYDVVLHCFVALLGGYILARYNFKAKKALLIFIIFVQVIPGVLTFVPSFLMMNRIPFFGGNNWLGQGGHGLIDSRLVLYLPVGWGIFMNSFLFMLACKGFPSSFEEAAEIDGYGFWRILFQIVLPMQGAILAVIAITSALGAWNDWFTPFLYITNPSRSTLAGWLGVLVTQLQVMGERKYPRVFSLSTLAMIPPLVIFLCFQKYVIQGIASVGIKE
jgi:multiple sugar transport system permease protein